jgi:simple sugar transport system ATP-binding protein
MSTAMALEAHQIVKRFGGRLANDHATLSLPKGTIHALVGENGAGKSTLCKILFGLLQPDSGEVVIHGQHVRLNSPRDAMRVGVGMVHQHFMLVESLTVAQNVALGHEPRKGPFVDDDAARRLVHNLSERFGLAVEADSCVGDLPVGVQQRVEILKALSQSAQTVILDEPTAVLTPQEVNALFGVLRRLRDEGRSILLVTHKLGEVLALCDSVTVLRAGRTVCCEPVAGATVEKLSAWMVGRSVDLGRKPRTAAVAQKRLSVEDLTVRGPNGRLSLEAVSLDVRAGEIVGVAGVEGNGQTELAHAITGVLRPERGRILIDGHSHALDVRDRRERGLAHVPEDRLTEGLAPSMRVDENSILGRHHHPPFAHRGLMRRRAVQEHCHALVARFDVRPAMPELPIGVLSGGNQQKLLVGRELSSNPRVLLLSQPTRGVDVGAMERIHGAIRAARDQGVAILLISAELSELLALCDVIHVIYRGRLVHTADATATTPERLGPYMVAGGTE